MDKDNIDISDSAQENKLGSAQEKSDNSPHYLLIILLIIISIIVISARVIFADKLQVNSDIKLWSLSFEIFAEATQKDLELKVAVPIETKVIKVVERKIYHPGFTVKVINHPGDKKISAKSRQTGHA